MGCQKRHMVALALVLTGMWGGTIASAQDLNPLLALTDRAALAEAQIYRQLRPYDRALQMRVGRGAITSQQAVDLLKSKGEDLARGAASASQLQDEERQEADVFFNAVLQTVASSTRWPSDKTPAYHRAYAESLVQIAREDFGAAYAAGRSTEPALSTAYRALALARGELVQVATPFRNAEQRIAASIDLPRTAAAPPLSTAPVSTPPVFTTPPQRGQAVGCFKDTNAPFDLDGFLERSNQNTPERCIAICASKGFRFAGVQYGQSCLCGNSYGRYGPASNCSMACTGNSGQVCGGMNSNSVYRTGL